MPKVLIVTVRVLPLVLASSDDVGGADSSDGRLVTLVVAGTMRKVVFAGTHPFA